MYVAASQRGGDFLCPRKVARRAPSDPNMPYAAFEEECMSELMLESEIGKVMESMDVIELAVDSGASSSVFPR